MKPKDLIVRCYAQKSGDVWQAVCIDLNLAAQDPCLAKAKEKLDAQIYEYIFDAVAGEDRSYADELLNRKAPLSLRAKYYLFFVLQWLDSWKNGGHKSFKLPVPLVPARV
jgi:hypothetical protein